MLRKNLPNYRKYKRDIWYFIYRTPDSFLISFFDQFEVSCDNLTYFWLFAITVDLCWKDIKAELDLRICPPPFHLENSFDQNFTFLSLIDAIFVRRRQTKFKLGFHCDLENLPKKLFQDFQFKASSKINMSGVTCTPKCPNHVIF